MLMNLAFALRPENYKMKLKESSIEKNSWKQSVLLFRTVRLDIFPFQETILHLHESCDKVCISDES